MKAAGYIRVSTDEQAREGVSLDNQRAKIQAYCQLHDLELVAVLDDPGRSGKDLNREGVQTLLDMIRARKVDAVVVYKLDRLSRRVRDTLSIMDLVDKRGIAFHSITERIDTKSAMGKFFLNIMASMNQWERDTISERTRDALQLKIRNHQRAGQVGYGWRLANDGKSLEPDEYEQRTICLIQDLNARGFGYRAICKELEREGHQPVGKQWHHQTIANILQKVANG